LGAVGQLALKGLHGRGVTTFSLVNRTQARATELATLYGGQPYTLADLPTVLQHADIVITATSATEPRLPRAQEAAAVQDRGTRPLTLIDLAVPRDIEPAVATVPAVTLYDVDDLRTVVDNALVARQAELPQVKAIIAELVDEWHQQLRELTLRPVVVGLRQQAEQMRRQAVARTLRHLEREQGEVDAGTAAQLAHLSRALVNQLLHMPTVKLKQKAGQPEGATYAALICELFDLDIPLSDENETDRSELIDNNDRPYNLSWIVDDTAQGFVGEYYPCPAGGEGICTAHADGLYCLPIRADKTTQYDYELVGQP
jgi:glutamyl-tRNA reductase